MIGLGYKSIHACVNDCFLFRGDANKDVHFCPACKTSRSKDSNTPGKKVSKKVLCYFLMIPRLHLLYKSSHTEKEMTWHATGKCTEPGLAVDGFNLPDNLSQSYSMWPVILITYNMPPWLCMKKSSFMLTLLILGTKSLGKDIDVYLRHLIDDLKDLWAKLGVKTIDVVTGQKFNTRAMVLWTITDFPSRSSLFRCSGQVYKACPTCNEDTLYRRSLEFNGEKEDRDPPREFGLDNIQAQLVRLPTHVKGKHPKFKVVMHIEKNVLESILNTLLMNDKSKDTAKARQDLKRLGIQSGLWLGQNKNGKCSKPQAVYSFTPEDRKSFVSSSKELNYQMGILSPDIAKPLIELCLFFKQICSQTLMVDDMLKAQSKVIDILCNLELIYPPSFFDIMIHLVIHLPLEAIDGGPIRPQWMYLFERFMKRLKNYVRNKAKPEGLIAKGYVAEEALTFSSHYFWDVTKKFNRLDRNVDFPRLMCHFQVFKSLCKSISLRLVIHIDHQELKKVIWYVLHNSPEIDTYLAKFKSEFPNKDMKEEILGWFGKQANLDLLCVFNCKNNDIIFCVLYLILSSSYIRQCHVDNVPGVSESSELFALAYGPSQTPISVNSCVVNDVDAPSYIIDVVEDDDIIDEEDPILHDLVDFDAEDLVNLDIDDGMSADVTRGHDGGSGNDDRPLPYQIPTGCGGCLETMMPLGDHVAHWSNYLRELVREFPLHYPSWCQMSLERKAGVVAKIKAALKERYWVPNPEDGTYDVERIRRGRPSHICECMEITYDPNPPADETQSRLLKEYLIKFSVMNGKKPLTLNFKTFTTSNGLYYNNDEYVAHPLPQAESSWHPEIELTAHMIPVNNQKDSVSPLSFYGNKKKVKSQTVTPTLPKSQGPENLGSLSKKRQKPKSKKTPTKIQLTSPIRPMEGLRSTSLDEGTRKLQPLLEGTTIDPKDSGGNVYPVDKELPFMVSDEGKVKTTSCTEGARRDKDLEGLKPPTDMEPLTNPVADPSGTGAKCQVDETLSTRFRQDSRVVIVLLGNRLGRLDHGLTEF
nr:hypothetical protein [Tanacetum cinerariifolium]